MTSRQFLIRVLLPILTASAVVQEAIDRTPERVIEEVEALRPRWSKALRAEGARPPREPRP